MKRIRDFLCNTDPENLTMGTIVATFLIFTGFVLGSFLHLLALIVLGILILGVMISIAFGLYLAIKWAQMHCEDKA